MPWIFPTRLAKPRFKIRSMIALVAIVAACLGLWREYWSPRRVWRRAIHAPKIERVEHTDIFGHPNRPLRHVFERSEIWPIRDLRIKGLDEAESLDELELAMSDPDASIRKEVYWLVVYDSPPSDPSIAIRLLAHGLDDRDELVRAAAVHGLGGFVKPGDPLAGKIFGMLDDQSPIVRTDSVYVCCDIICRDLESARLSGLPKDHDPRIAAFLSMLDDPDSQVQAATIDSIEFLFQHDRPLADSLLAGAKGRTLLDALESKLGDPNPNNRAMAAFVLASHGRGLETVPMLIDFATHLESRRLNSPSRLSRAIGNWSPEKALALLASRSDEAASYFFDRLVIYFTGEPSEAWRLLVEIASRSPDARARIERLAIDRIAIRFPYVQAQLALILQAIGSRHDVLPELIEGSLDAQEYIRRDSIQALKARLAFDSRVLPRLREASRNEDEYKAPRAAAALEEIESTPTRPMAGDER